MKNQQIEGLRGAACLIIVLFHILYQYKVFVLEEAGPVFLQHLGEFGVAIFLFISGYYMIDFEGKNFKLSNYYSKRFSRLFPIYAISVSLIFIVRSFTNVSNFDEVTIQDWILNVSFVNGFIGSPYIEPAHWYMTTLIRAILLSGIIQYFKLQRHTELFGVLLCLIVGMKVLQRITDNDLLLSLCGVGLKITGGSYMGVFVLAYMMRKINQSNGGQNILVECRKELGVIAIAIIYLIGLPGVTYTLLCCAGGVLVFLCLQEKLPFMDNKLLRGVARISFVWYLTHQYIAYYIEQTITGKGIPFFIAASAAFIVTAVLAVILHICLEKPIERMMLNRKS